MHPIRPKSKGWRSQWGWGVGCKQTTFLCSGPAALQTASEDGPHLHRAAADVTISQAIVKIIKYTVWGGAISLIFVSLTDHNRRKAAVREIEGGEWWWVVKREKLFG